MSVLYSRPPERAEAVVSSEVVSGWAKEFNLDSIVRREKESLLPLLKNAKQHGSDVLEMEPSVRDGTAFVAAAFGDNDVGMGNDEDDDDDDDDDDDEEEGGMEVGSEEYEESGENEGEICNTTMC
jgi:hypothetical protein